MVPAKQSGVKLSATACYDKPANWEGCEAPVIITSRKEKDYRRSAVEVEAAADDAERKSTERGLENAPAFPLRPTTTGETIYGTKRE